VEGAIEALIVEGQLVNRPPSDEERKKFGHGPRVTHVLDFGALSATPERPQHEIKPPEARSPPGGEKPPGDTGRVENKASQPPLAVARNNGARGRHGALVFRGFQPPGQNHGLKTASRFGRLRFRPQTCD
jgi:hypothetical protein